MSASDYGFKLSMPGYDVKTATPEQCAVHSSYPPLKAKTDQDDSHFALLDVDFTGTVTQNTTLTIYSIPHGYGYIPFTLSNIIFNSDTIPGTEVVGIGYAGVGVNLAIKAYSTASNFIVTIFDNFNWTNSTARLRVSYYIFAEDGS